jgi:putative tryptophan/tyrosine transport system substrate-binding protein
MRRRELFALLGSAAIAAPFAARAQLQPRLPVVGILTPHLADPGWAGFFEQLGAHGWEDGRNVRILMRSAEGKLERLSQLAVELVAAGVDVIVAVNTPGTRAAIDATRKIPIVMGIVGDPLASGFVTNLARPEGNVTGVTNLSVELAAKRLQLLKETLPGSRRIAVLFNPDDPITKPQIEQTKQRSQTLDLEIRTFPIRNQEALVSAFADMTTWRADGGLWLTGQSTPFVPATVEIGIDRRLPIMVVQPSEVRAGGLIAYYPDHRELFARVATYVDSILKGAKPAELPVEQPTKFYLVINLKTAKALGITIPPIILLQASEVIE